MGCLLQLLIPALIQRTMSRAVAKHLEMKYKSCSSITHQCTHFLTHATIIKLLDSARLVLSTVIIQLRFLYSCALNPPKSDLNVMCAKHVVTGTVHTFETTATHLTMQVATVIIQLGYESIQILNITFANDVITGTVHI